MNGPDQQSIVTRQCVTHAIQFPVSGEWILPKKTFSINENIQVDPICFSFMAKISEICKETHNRRFGLELGPKNILRSKDD